MEVVQDFDYSFDQALLNLCCIKKHELKLKSHGAHHLSRHGPVGCY